MAKKLSNKKVQQQFGHGIDALFNRRIEEEMAEDPEKVVRELSNKFAMIPVGEIERNPDQPRMEFDQEALQELAESIKLHGIIQPLTVRLMAPGQYQIISGERRWRAAREAGLEEVPAYIRVANDQSLMEMALIENIQREDLNAFEIAVSYHRLKEEFRLTDEDLAQRVGKKRSTITNYLRLLDAHIDVQEAVKSNQISMGHAKAIAGIDKLLQKDFLAELLKRNWSVRETENRAASYAPASKKSTKNTGGKLSPEHQQILRDFQGFFGSGQIRLQLENAETGKGQLIISFKDHKELTELFKCIEQ